VRWSLVSVAVAASRIASADVELAWHAPAGCPDEAAIRDAIVRHLDAPPDPAQRAPGHPALYAREVLDGRLRDPEVDIEVR